MTLYCQCADSERALLQSGSCFPSLLCVAPGPASCCLVSLYGPSAAHARSERPNRRRHRKGLPRGFDYDVRPGEATVMSSMRNRQYFVVAAASRPLKATSVACPINRRLYGMLPHTSKALRLQRQHTTACYLTPPTKGYLRIFLRSTYVDYTNSI
eukprot:scaffold4516_cov417-Prasinococcus_capsulatus_cf.AAC.4